MDPVSVSALVLSIIGIVASTISPLVVAGAYFINRITQSDCCGSHVALAEPSQNQPLNPPVNLNVPK
jgi:hypothetical protein